MTITRLLSLGIALAALCNCAAARSRTQDTMSTTEAARAEEGRLVTVRGYLVFGSHARQLWHSKRARRRGMTSSCLTLVETGKHRQTLSRNSNKVIIITGRMRRDVTTGVVDYGACNQVGIAVETVYGTPTGGSR